MALVSLNVKEAERRERAQLAGLRALGRATRALPGNEHSRSKLDRATNES